MITSRCCSFRDWNSIPSSHVSQSQLPVTPVPVTPLTFLHIIPTQVHSRVIKNKIDLKRKKDLNTERLVSGWKGVGGAQ